MEKVLQKLKSLACTNFDFIGLLITLFIKYAVFVYISDINQNYYSYILFTLSLINVLMFGVFLKPGFRFVFILLLNVSLSFIMFVDILYLRFFNDLISISIFKEAWQLRELGGSIRELMEYKDVLFIIDIPFIIIYCKRLYKKLKFYQQIACRRSNLVLMLCVLLITVIGWSIRLERHSTQFKQVFQHRFSNKIVAEYIGINNYHIYDLYKYINYALNGNDVTLEQVKQVEQLFEKYEENNVKGNLYDLAKGKNLILIQEESLQQFVIGLKIHGQEITPNLNRLIRQGFYFNNFYDQTFLGRTSDAEFISLVSLYPSKKGSIYFNFSQNTFDSLPQVLNQNGYETFAAHAFDGAFWNRANMYRRLGFSESMFKKDFTSGENLGWGLSDGEFFRQVAAKVKNFEQPFFAFLATLTTHHPYNYIPQEEKELKLGGLEGSLMGDYLQTIHYADKALGQFIKEVKSKGLYESTVFVVYGDHDAALPDKELKKIGVKPSNKKQYDKVPLVLFGQVLDEYSGTKVI